MTVDCDTHSARKSGNGIGHVFALASRSWSGSQYPMIPNSMEEDE